MAQSEELAHWQLALGRAKQFRYLVGYAASMPYTMRLVHPAGRQSV